MTANLDAEEIEALLGDDEDTGEESPAVSVDFVRQRDFEQIKRLDAVELHAIQRKLEGALPPIESDLGLALRQTVEVGFGSTSECNATDLFRQDRGPAALVRFRCGGHPGWCRWELVPALAALEHVLGAGPDSGEPEERPLSGLERTLLVRILRTLLLQVGNALGLTLEGFEALPTFKHAGSYTDCEPAPDPYRLILDLDLRIGDQLSGLRLILPIPERGWVRPDPAPELDAEGLPLHLLGVGMDVAVHLGHTSLSVRDLMALEPGDVVPLSTPVHRPAVLDVDGRAIGLATVGKHRGRLAIRITDLDPGLAPTDR